MEKYLKKVYYFAVKFDREPSYHVRDLKFYLGELKDGTIFENMGMTAMEAAEKFMQKKSCGEQILCLWNKIKGEQLDETLE